MKILLSLSPAILNFSPLEKLIDFLFRRECPVDPLYSLSYLMQSAERFKILTASYNGCFECVMLLVAAS
jgi:hypothetical protein